MHFDALACFPRCCELCALGAMPKEYLLERFWYRSTELIDAMIQLMGDFFDDYIAKAEQAENKHDI